MNCAPVSSVLYLIFLCQKPFHVKYSNAFLSVGQVLPRLIGKTLAIMLIMVLDAAY